MLLLRRASYRQVGRQADFRFSYTEIAEKARPCRAYMLGVADAAAGRPRRHSPMPQQNVLDDYTAILHFKIYARGGGEAPPMRRKAAGPTGAVIFATAPRISRRKQAEHYRLTARQSPMAAPLAVQAS